MTREYKPSADALAEVQEHLAYEVRMLFESAFALQQSSAETSTDTLLWCRHNALLEAFLIHARALIDFLYPPQASDKDDVFARHFLDNPSTWSRKRSRIPPLLKSVRDRANKEVAHLTYTRVSIGPEDKRWSFIKIAKAIGSDLACFVRSASRDKLSQALANTLSDYASRADKIAVIEATASTTGDPKVIVTSVPASGVGSPVDGNPQKGQGDAVGSWWERARSGLQTAIRRLLRQP